MNSAKGYGNATFSYIVLFLISPVPNPPCTNHVKTERRLRHRTVKKSPPIVEKHRAIFIMQIGPFKFPCSFPAEKKKVLYCK